MAILTGQAARDYIASGKPYRQLNQQELTAGQEITQPVNRGPVENILLGLTSGVRGLGSQAAQLVGGVGELAQGYMSGKSPEEVAASTDINKYAGLFLTPEETKVAKEDPLRFGTGTALENLTFALPAGKGITGMAKMGALGGGMSGLGTGLKQEDLSQLPGRVATGAALGGVIGGALGGVQKGVQKLQKMRLEKELKGIGYEQLTPQQLEKMDFDSIMAKYDEMPETWKSAFEMQNRGRGFRFLQPTKKTGEFKNVLREMQEDMVAMDVVTKMTGEKMGLTGRGILKMPEIAGQVKTRLQSQWGDKIVGNKSELVDAAVSRGVKEFGKTRQQMLDAIARVKNEEGFIVGGQAGLDWLNNKKGLTMGDLANISSNYKSSTWDAYTRIAQSGSNFGTKDQMNILAKQLMGQEARNLISATDPLLDVPYRAWEAWATQNQNIIGNLNQQASNLLPAGRGSLIEKIQSPVETGLGTLGRKIFSGNIPKLPQGTEAALGLAGTIAPRVAPMIQGQQQPAPIGEDLMQSPVPEVQSQEVDRSAIVSQLLSQGYSVNEALALAKYLYPAENSATAKQRQSIEMSIANIDRISGLVDQYGGYFNPLTNIANPLLQQIDPQRAYVSSAVGSNAQQLIRELHGTGVISNQDREWLQQFVPNLGDTDQAAKSKLQNFRDYLVTKLQVYGGGNEAYDLLQQ